nr:NAD(P)H-binding protein [Mycobacterium sp. OAS707]
MITGAGGGSGSISRRVVEALLDGGAQVRAMVRRDDERAGQLRAMGAEVILGDLTRAGDIVDALDGVRRMFFNMSVSPDYLRATTEVCAVALERAKLDVIVNMSQMTVSQMTLTSTSESKQHRLHWLAEHVLNWSGLPVIHVRPTSFLDNPLFTLLAKQSVRERGVLPLPFGTGRTSPISADDVARVVAALLVDPGGRIGQVCELTGPEVLDMNGLAEQYSRALNRPITAEDVPLDEWERVVLAPLGLPDHLKQHLATMARLHREGRYDRRTDDVEQITGRPAQSVEQYVAANPDLFY